MLRSIEEILKRKTTPYSQKEMEETAEVVLVIRAALQARIMHESVMAHISGRDSPGGFRFGRVFFFFFCGDPKTPYTRSLTMSQYVSQQHMECWNNSKQSWRAGKEAILPSGWL